MYPEILFFAHLKMAALHNDTIAGLLGNPRCPKHSSAADKYKGTVKVYRQIVSLCHCLPEVWSTLKLRFDDQMVDAWKEFEATECVCFPDDLQTLRLGSSWASDAHDIANLEDLQPEELEQPEGEQPEDMSHFFSPSRSGWQFLIWAKFSSEFKKHD